LNVPWVMRSRDDITRFFDGTELLEPGLVPIDEWRPDDQGATGVDRTGRRTPIYGGVGHKA
jgi:S-adenosyl methyltransferase